MKKRLQNLELLCNKLQYRYGEDDDLVLQLKQELEILIAKTLAKSNQGRRKDDTGAKAESSMALH
ncbi:hypothetical protein [Polaromonas naphthalenivorans]|uniref:Uncharacterized protein n=1 Tax=Polaromonas naphthalenivorans (strain CJ2) TaxID=365044 RepID=A1VT69_POLNA|nr:hypothetical protein [Polaromonas naphthalenivorans]ABM38847.1 hypothetical protein Pnap_3551 [Polaromonas naphthalenivorans CJ2]